LGAFYGSCMDEDAIEKAGAKPLDAYMKMIATVKDAKSAQNVIIKLHAAGMSPVFGVGPMQDFADASKVIVGLDQSGLGLYDKKFYLNDDGNLKAVRAAYADHVAKMFTLLGGQDADAATDAIAVETELAKAQQDEDARNDPHNLYHPVDRK